VKCYIIEKKYAPESAVMSESGPMWYR